MKISPSSSVPQRGTYAITYHTTFSPGAYPESDVLGLFHLVTLPLCSKNRGKGAILGEFAMFLTGLEG